MKTNQRILPIAGLVGLTMLAVSCSQDRHTFHSTPLLPANIAIVDLLTEKQLWAKEIPVGQSLMIDFDRKGDIEWWTQVKDLPATRMKWRLYRRGRIGTIASDRIDLPGTPILFKVSYRPSPEYPPDHDN